MAGLAGRYSARGAPGTPASTRASQADRVLAHSPDRLRVHMPRLCGMDCFVGTDPAIPGDRRGFSERSRERGSLCSMVSSIYACFCTPQLSESATRWTAEIDWQLSHGNSPSHEQLSKAQLNALRRQLEPHFLFNTLHTIAGLVRDTRKEAAVAMIANLSDLLRGLLEGGEQQEICLGEELEFLEKYS